MSSSRREFIRNTSLLTGGIGLNIKTKSNKKYRTNEEGDRLVLLGTQGGPVIRSYQQTPSASLIVHNKIPFVIDAGYGVTLKLKEAGINLSQLKYIFISHHHSDHNLELGNLIYNAWVSGLSEPVNVYGPIGLNSLLNYYWKSNEYDIDLRIRDEARFDIRDLVITHEYTEGGILSTGNFEINSLKNMHPPVTESYALGFKFAGKKIVFSGDTAYFPALATFASGADYLIHEAMYPAAVEEMVKRRPNAPKLKASILSHHTSAEDAGKIAKAANVKNLILNHFVPPDDKTLTEDVWINSVRKNFSGNIIIGKDLLQFAL